MNEKMRSGIYIVECLKDGRFYIGMSKDVEGRLNVHRKDLQTQNHCCREMQEAWNRHGEEAFSFRLLARVPSEHLSEAEQVWLQGHFHTGMMFNKTKNRQGRTGVRRPKREPVVVAGPFLRAEQAAAYCGMPEPDFQALRAKKQGPRAFKVGRCVIYATGYLDRWVEERQEAA